MKNLCKKLIEFVKGNKKKSIITGGVVSIIIIALIMGVIFKNNSGNSYSGVEVDENSGVISEGLEITSKINGLAESEKESQETSDKPTEDETTVKNTQTNDLSGNTSENTTGDLTGGSFGGGTEQNVPANVSASTGALKVSGKNLVDEKGNIVQLRGISTHGINWFPDYINNDCFKQLHEEFGVNVIRLAMYSADYNGYCTGGDKNYLKGLIDDGVKYATQNNMYVIIDWHILSDNNPNTYANEARSFFDEMSKKYSNHTNVLYEICNEPNGGTSWDEIKTYAVSIIDVIRKNDPDSVIIVGTPMWCQEVDKAAKSPITGYANIMYSLHFYAATHTDNLRNVCISAANSGLPMFVTEFGICDASGNGGINENQAGKWISLLNENNISYCMWSLCNKAETASIIDSSCTKVNGFTLDDLSSSGRWFLNMMTGKLDLPYHENNAKGNGNTIISKNISFCFRYV